MHRLIAKLKRRKTSHMSEEPSTSETIQPAQIQVTNTVLPPPPSAPILYVPDQTVLFMEAYECAKNNRQWHRVTSAISDHPEWLTRIPTGRRWTMLHQIVFCGNVPHLNEILTYEITNGEFRLLCKASDDKTVREVAAERAHVHPQMLRRIERLVAIDQVLNNARDGKWALVKQFLRQQSDIVNEKSPYRQYYLAHFLASIGHLEMFKELSEICTFRLDLKADEKTISQVARENHHIEFAEYVENLHPNTNEIIEINNSEPMTTDDPDIPNSTNQSAYFSQGFYDDPGIVILSVNGNPFGSMFLSHDEPISYPNHHHYPSDATYYPTQHQHPTSVTMVTANSYQNPLYENQQAHPKPSPANSIPPMTDEEQAEYEKTVINNAKKFPGDNLLSAITCCITKGIIRDPVVATDGFTYEREAILNWFQHSNRSPMTNEVVQSQELKPNYAIKSILQSLSEPSVPKTKSYRKSKDSNHGAK